MVAHTGVPGPFTLKTLVTGWAFEPVPLALIVVAGFLYWAGLRRLSGPPVWRGGRTWSWYGGLAAALVAVASPIDTYADVSFSTHMVQHVLLLFVAAPLFALGAPVTLALRASRPATRRRFLLPVLHSRVVRVLTHPLVAVALFMGTQFVTHLTGFYEAALTSSIVHDLEHALYLTTALLFWWPVVGLDPAPNKMSHPARICGSQATSARSSPGCSSPAPGSATTRSASEGSKRTKTAAPLSWTLRTENVNRTVMPSAEWSPPRNRPLGPLGAAWDENPSPCKRSAPPASIGNVDARATCGGSGGIRAAVPAGGTGALGIVVCLHGRSHGYRRGRDGGGIRQSHGARQHHSRPACVDLPSSFPDSLWKNSNASGDSAPRFPSSGSSIMSRNWRISGGPCSLSPRVNGSP